MGLFQTRRVSRTVVASAFLGFCAMSLGTRAMPADDTRGAAPSGEPREKQQRQSKDSPEGKLPPLVAVLPELGTRETLCSRVNYVALSPNGKTLAYTLGATVRDWQGYEGTIFLCDVGTGKEIGRLVGDKNERVQSMIFYPDGKKLIMHLSTGASLLWDLDAGKVLLKFEGGIRAGPSIFSQDGKTLVGTKCDEERRKWIERWDPATGKVIHRFEIKDQNISGLALSADGRYVVIEDSEMDTIPTAGVTGLKKPSTDWHWRATAHLWELATGKYFGQIGPLIEGAEDNLPFGRKMHEAGAFAHGFRVRISESGLIALFPSLRPDRISMQFEEFRKIHPPREGVPNDLMEFVRFNGRIEWAAISPDGNTLVVHGWYETKYNPPALMLLDISSLNMKTPSPDAKLPAHKLEALWGNLASADASTAHQAADTLAKFPKPALAFLKEQVHPVAKLEKKQIDKWVADLGNGDFEVREKAEKALLQSGERIIAVLRVQLKSDTLPAEPRRRIEEIVSKLSQDNMPDADTRRHLWTIELLEHLGTRDARQLLETMADGPPEAWVTQEAKLALKRLNRKP